MYYFSLFNIFKYSLPFSVRKNNSSVFIRATIGEGASSRLLLGFYQYKGSFFTGLYIVKPGTSTFTDDEVLPQQTTDV